MRYVARDTDGKLVGHYANPNPHTEPVPVADDHPDILAFAADRAARQAATRAEAPHVKIPQIEARLAAMEERLAALENTRPNRP